MRGRAAVTPEHAYRSCASAIDLIVHITTGRRAVDRRASGTGSSARSSSATASARAAARRVTDVFVPGPDGRAVPEHDPVDLADYVRVGFDPGWLRPGRGRWAGAAGGRR